MNNHHYNFTPIEILNSQKYRCINVANITTYEE
jgi:hypothetical protein